MKQGTESKRMTRRAGYEVAAYRAVVRRGGETSWKSEEVYPTKERATLVAQEHLDRQRAQEMLAKWDQAAVSKVVEAPPAPRQKPWSGAPETPED